MKYAYKARNLQGVLMTGVLEVASEEQVVQSLDAMGYSILQIQPVEPTATASPFDITNFFKRFQKVNKQEVILLTRQLAALIRSGMPLLPSLTTLCDQTTQPQLQVILNNIRQSVQGGESFSNALAKYPAVFSDFFVSMVRVGETGGILDEVLNRLAVLGTQEMEIQSKIKSALTYPVVLMILAFLMVNFIMVAVVPKFVMVFNASDAALPLPTQIVLAMSWVFRKAWYMVLIVVGVLVYYFQKFISTEKGLFAFHKLMMKVPVFGALYTKIQVSRFARTLATLTTSGIPVLQGLQVVETTVNNRVIRATIRNIASAITAGSSLVEPFRASGVFSPMVVQMISVGEKSGNLDEMLEQIANFYDPEIEYTIKDLTSLIEPFMLLGMGLMVGFIALAVLLPIFNLIKVFRA